jgi:ubiquinone/menaquinone biosynthesis C-methylase UbiE/uncharacterized protein YbaR (Trm112 family)
MKRQSVENQKGEIEFRKKLYLQQVDNQTVFDDEFDADGIEKILMNRMKKTFDQMTRLKNNHIILSPYIEIGAERCQRSLVMENDLGPNKGAALDISFDMLKSCDHYRNVYNKTNLPLRICCDANNLPFLSDSIPFIFCYETLHHFPDPAAITKEIYRVLLPGGCFFFDEEPFKQVLHLNLYKGKKLYSKESLARNKIKTVFDHFFSARTCNEVEHGIIENDDLSLKLWKHTLAHFDEKEVKLATVNIFQSDLFHPHSNLIYFINYLLGGTISGICRKAGVDKHQYKKISDTLICPSCRALDAEVMLRAENSRLICSKCSKIYPIIDQILFLFAYDTFEKLYPAIFNSCQKHI